MPLLPLPSDPTDRAALIDQLISRLRADEVLVLPTDTVYGVVARAGGAGGLERLRSAKGRPAEVPIAVLVADRAQGEALADSISPGAAALIDRWWPGPLTLVVQAGTDAPDVGGDGSIGLRCPDDDLLRALASAVGPLAATSANRHGLPTPATAAEVAAMLPGLLVVDDGPRGAVASTVVDVRCSPVVVLREGALATSDVQLVVAHIE